MSKSTKQLARELQGEATRREKALRQHVTREERELAAIREAAEALRGPSPAVVSNRVSNGRK